MISRYGPLTDDTRLYQLWEEIVGEPGFGRRSLWLIFVDAEGYPADLVVPVDDIPEQVDLGGIGRLLDMIREQFPSCAVAAMLSRPGSGRLRPTDVDWARAVEDLLAHQPRRWPMHLATDDGLRVIAADDLVAPRSA